jgi:curved DNA-binding protein CbpA
MSPSATGTLAATPLAHALVYARNRRLTGRLELLASDGRSATLTIWHGSITTVETTPIGLCPGGFFGAVAYELGFIDATTLDSTLLEIAKTKRLHGEVLIERKAITAAQRDEVLVEQIHRKVHHLFSLPDTTKYSFYDAKAPPFEPPVAVDCVGPVWRGIRDYPPVKFVMETTARIANNHLRATTGGSARLPPAETALFQALASRPMTIDEMRASTDLPSARVELLVYLLVIAKCVEAVSGVRTHPSTGALPVSMPSGPLRAISGEIPRNAAHHYSSGAIAAVRPPSAVAPGSTPNVPAVRPSSSGMPAVRASAPSIPAVRASAPSIPAVRASAPSIPAVRPSAPSIPAVRGSSPAVAAARGSSAQLPSQAGASVASASTLVTLKSPAELGHAGITARAATVEQESYFDALGVPDGASVEAVRAAYIRLAKVWHPDRIVTDFLPVRDDIIKIFSYMTRAQQTLCDPETRRAYLALRDAKHDASQVRPREVVLREAARLLERRDFDLVMGLAQELIGRDPDDAEALALHTWASTRGGEAADDDVRAALPKMDRAINMDRTNDQAVYYRGLVHKRLGNVPAAFRDFARALQLNPRHIAAEREVRIFAMRVKKGSGEHKLIAPILEKLTGKK